MTRRFDLIAFDWDGTLFDSTASIVRCLQDAVADVGGQRPTREQAAYVIGLALPQALRAVAPDVDPSRYGELGERYRHHYVRHRDDITLFAGVVPMLQALRERGVQLAVATGKSRRGLDDALQQVGLDAVFAASRTADQTAGKPDPLMLRELMDELDVPPERTLMVGDTTHDLLMARHAGCASVAVAYGAHDHAHFAEFAPLSIAHSVAELQQWLLAHTAPNLP